MQAIAIVILFLVFALGAGLPQAHASPTEGSESIILGIGDTLVISSSQDSLQSVEIQGNLTAAKFEPSSGYPTDGFEFTSSAQDDYSIRLTFSYPSEYEVTLSTAEGSGARLQKTAYYTSSGEFILTIEAGFRVPEETASSPSMSAWDSFLSWTGRFGDAFPLWVKFLYALLALQFVVVGYKWIGFENATREEESQVSKFDRGNLLYLWSEVFWKFLLTAFIVIAVVMSGQFVLLSVLKFMFLVQVKMLNLWDLYVLGFAAAIAGIAYVFKLAFEKSFDLKPLFQE